MKLSALVPPLPAELAQSLDEKCGLRTESDLLFDGSPLDVYYRLLPTTLSLREFIAYILLATEKAAAPADRADELLAVHAQELVQLGAQGVSSGIPSLDKLLNFGATRVVEISGDRGSGKTTLARHIVLRHLAQHPDSEAFWVDTMGDFSVDRVSAALVSNDGPGVSTAMERLHVSHVFDIDAAHDILSVIRSKTQLARALRVVVFDCITPLLSPLLSPVSSQGHAITTTFMRQLRALASSRHLSVFVINNATPLAQDGNAPRHNPHSAFPDTVKKPALGPSFSFLTDATLWLSAMPSPHGAAVNELHDCSTTHVAEVLRSKSTRSRTWCAFRIRDGSIHEYDYGAT